MQTAADTLWDAVVIGAGPSGSTAAYHLARAGHSVLLVDGDAFPREKVCGEGLIADAHRALSRMGLLEEVRRIAHPLRAASITSPSGVEVTLDGDFLTLRRLFLDGILVRRAVEVGAVFALGRAVGVCEQAEGVLLAFDGWDGRIRARAAVVASGALSPFARRLGFISGPPSGVAVRRYLRSDHHLDRIVASYARPLLPGYCWIFPLGEGLYNVGSISFRRPGGRKRPDLPLLLEGFLADSPEGRRLLAGRPSIGPLQGGILRCGLEGARPRIAGKVLGVGDAIGATLPLSGEGIGKAMETGEMAAREMSAALNTGDFGLLEGYPRRLAAELGPRYDGYRRMEGWLSNPRLLDLIAWRGRRSSWLRGILSRVLSENLPPPEGFSLKAIFKSFLKD